MSPYKKTVFQSTEDCGYIAEAPDLEYCSAFGETPEEALAELEIAIEAWLQSAEENGKPIPIPADSNVRFTTGTTGELFRALSKPDQTPQLTIVQELVPA
jgi:predicted RNase H-like HicB family nuclease